MPKSKIHNFIINTILNKTLTRKEGRYDANPAVSLLQLNTQNMLMNLWVSRLFTASSYRYTSMTCYGVLSDVFTLMNLHMCQAMCIWRNCREHWLSWEADGYSASL